MVGKILGNTRIGNDSAHIFSVGNLLDMYGSTIVGEMYVSSMVGVKLDPNDELICDDKRHKTRKRE